MEQDACGFGKGTYRLEVAAFGEEVGLAVAFGVVGGEEEVKFQLGLERGWGLRLGSRLG